GRPNPRGRRAPRHRMAPPQSMRSLPGPWGRPRPPGAGRGRHGRPTAARGPRGRRSRADPRQPLGGEHSVRRRGRGPGAGYPSRPRGPRGPARRVRRPAVPQPSHRGARRAGLRRSGPGGPARAAGCGKVVARRAFHLTDVVHTIATIRRGGLDWEYIIATARALGARAGLSCYLHLVDDIHARLLGGELLTARTRRALGPRLSRRARFDRAGFHCSALWVTGRVHARQLAGALVSRDWAAARRLGLWPLAARGARLSRHTAAFHAWPQAAEARTS